jgi:single-strand DNA-binding protein
MSDFNQAILLGRLGQDPELRDIKGTSKVSMSVATKSVFTSQGERREKTTWHNVIAWGKQADLAAQYLHKGSRVLIIGEIEKRKWQPDDSDKPVYFVEVNARTIRFLDPKSSNDNPAPAQEPDDDDIPF